MSVDTELLPERGDPLAPGREPPDGDGRLYSLTALLALAVVLVATASAYLLAHGGEAIYGARAEFLYQGEGGEADDVPADRVIATQESLLRSRTVLQPVADAVGVPVASVEESLEVEVAQNNVLAITVGDPDPERAIGLARGVSRRYVDFVDGAGSAAIERGQQVLERRIERLAARRRLQASSGANARERIAIIEDRLADLELRRSARARVRVVTPPYLLPDPLEPQPERTAAIGLLVGLFIAAGVVALAWRARSRH